VTIYFSHTFIFFNIISISIIYININRWRRGTLKVIFINRKKVGIIVIIFGLMVTLLGISKQFDDKLKTTILVENNISLLNDFEALNGKFTYKLPLGWGTKEKKFSGGEIIYHNDFQSADAVIHGFVELWKSNQSLKTFLENSKNISQQQNEIKNYKIDSIVVNERKAYLVQYLINVDNNNWYKAYEYFIEDGKEFYRISFFTRKVNFKETFGAIFESIIETLKIN
jgi:hypothetical protein